MKFVKDIFPDLTANLELLYFFLALIVLTAIVAYLIGVKKNKSNKKIEVIDSTEFKNMMDEYMKEVVIKEISNLFSDSEYMTNQLGELQSDIAGFINKDFDQFFKKIDLLLVEKINVSKYEDSIKDISTDLNYLKKNVAKLNQGLIIGDKPAVVDLKISIIELKKLLIDQEAKDSSMSQFKSDNGEIKKSKKAKIEEDLSDW